MFRITKNIYRKLILPLIIITAMNLNAQQARLSADSILIGDQIQLTLRIPADIADSIGFPVFENHIIEGIEIIKKSPVETTSDNLLQQIYTITSFEDSLFIIPPFKFIADGDTLETLHLMLNSSYYLPDSAFISRIDTTQAVPLAALKAPINTPMTFAEFKERFGKLILLILAALLLLAAGLYVYKRRKANKPIFKAPKPKIPPHKKALAALENIKEQGIPQGERVRKYYDEISYVIRVYIEERFAVPAPDYISYEIISALKSIPEIEEKQVANIEQMLRTADMVKFAKYIPEEYVSQQNLGYAFEFVNTTKEQEQNNEDEPQKITQPISTTKEK